MTASEFWLLVFAVISSVAWYWIGRSDGYEIRDIEKLERRISSLGKQG